tara:strand:+ start:1725 stop:2384 length:660 start_codon:yes stop_codon:yes gene_type:complete
MIIIIKIILSYLIGSISGSLLLGKFLGFDIRTMGSKNAGGTNAFRTQGALFGAIVIIIDIFKGYIATKYIPKLFLQFDYSIMYSNDLIIILCGFFAIVGHVYPVYYNFIGGKGAATAIGMILAIYWPIVILGFFIWLSILILSGYVGLSTMLTSVLLTIFSYIFYNSINNLYFLPFIIFFSLFMIYNHRNNIVRMVNGNENRFHKIMLFHNFFNQSSDG